MLKKVVEVSSGPTYLSLAHHQMVIERPEQEKRTLPIEDLGVLLLDNAAITCTQALLAALLDSGAAVVVCGANHLPAGLLLPFAGHSTQGERLRAQVDAGQPLIKRLWQTLVAAKLRQQAAVLQEAIGRDEGLAALARRVRSGDPDNLEAQGAQRYWPALLGRDFRRDRAGEAPNDLLNYGYAVLRATVGRALVASGLYPGLGIHHRNRANAFALADDAMEPYRPYVDWRVRQMQDGDAPWPQMVPESKRALLSILNETIVIDGRKSPLFLAIQSTAASLAESFLSGALSLALPEGLPIREGDAETPD
jgi:CRISPR-associated protein Cas1